MITYYASEIDKYAIAVTQKNYPHTMQLGDVTKIDWNALVDEAQSVDYLPDEKKIKINLPEEVWKNIDTVIMTRLFQEELVR